MLEEPTDNLVDDVMCVYPCIIANRSIYVTHKCFYHYRVRENSTKRTVRKDIPIIVKNIITIGLVDLMVQKKPIILNFRFVISYCICYYANARICLIKELRDI